MRARHLGRIINITSMGGFITLPGLGFYHGSKFALEGISESLGKEVKDQAMILRSGALPASIKYIEDVTIGPSLGADSIRAGVTAAIIGMLAVVGGVGVAKLIK